jgi:hypothetical protein
VKPDTIPADELEVLEVERGAKFILLVGRFDKADEKNQWHKWVPASEFKEKVRFVLEQFRIEKE